MSEATLMIEKAVGEAAWDPSTQSLVPVNTTLGDHPVRPGGKIGAITLHELGPDASGRGGFAIRGLRVDVPEQRPFGGQDSEFIFTQDQMDVQIGAYDPADGVWCGRDVATEPLSFATWVRAMLDRRGFDVRGFGDFHVHARSKEVGSGYVSWVYQISLRGMGPTPALWQTMWHYEPHPDGGTCKPLEVEPEVSAADEADLLDGLDVPESELESVQLAFALDGLDHEDQEGAALAEAQDMLDFEDPEAAELAEALDGLDYDDYETADHAEARDGLDFIDFDEIDDANDWN